jgi:hypothetical protein
LSTNYLSTAPPIKVTSGKIIPIRNMKMVEFLKAESTFLKKKPRVLLKLIKSSPNSVRHKMNRPSSLVKAVIYKMMMTKIKAIVGIM